MSQKIISSSTTPPPISTTTHNTIPPYEGSVSTMVEHEYQSYPITTNTSTTVRSVIHLDAFLRNNQTKERATESEFLAVQQQFPKTQIVFVLDTSGSMQSSMPILKKVMNMVVNHCNDYMSVVTFNSTVQTLSPMRLLDTDEKKKQMKKELKKLTADNSTDLCGGILQGLIELWTIPPVDLNERRSMVLLTDGETNMGLIDTFLILQRLQEQKYIKNTDIYCMALGDHVNQDLLQSIVVHSNGRLYAIQTDEDIPKMFGDCMGCVSSVFIKDCVLTVNSPFPITSLSPHYQNCTTSLSFHIGTLFFNDKRDFLFELEVPYDFSKDQNISVEVSYYDICTQNKCNHMVMVKPTFHFLEQKTDPNFNVLVQYLRIEVAQQIEQLAKLENEVPRKEILEKLQNTCAILKTHEDHPVAKELIRHIKHVQEMETIDMLPPRMLYREISTGLTLQRATTGSNQNSIYTSAIQRNYSEKYSKLNTDKEEKEEDCGEEKYIVLPEVVPQFQLSSPPLPLPCISLPQNYTTTKQKSSALCASTTQSTSWDQGYVDFQNSDPFVMEDALTLLDNYLSHQVSYPPAQSILDDIPSNSSPDAVLLQNINENDNVIPYMPLPPMTRSTNAPNAPRKLKRSPAMLNVSFTHNAHRRLDFDDESKAV